MDCARRLHNTTRCAALAVLLDDPSGRERFVTIIKASFYAPEHGPLAWAEPQPIRTRPLPWSDGRHASVRLPSDLADEKPGTDVLLEGTVHPPAGGAVRHQDVTLSVRREQATRIAKRVRVHGPRIWHQGATGVTPGPAGALVPTPLVWELAFGGADPEEPAFVDRRNPAGSGFAHKRRRLVGREAPRIESLEAPLASRHPAPAGFGPIAEHWEPRRRFAGTCDDTWRRWRAPFRPLDFDPRFHCWAPEDQQCHPPLAGDETIEIAGLRANTAWRFALPGYGPRIAFAKRAGFVYATPHLDTVFIDADRRRIDLCWRASTPLPRRAADLEAVLVLDPERAPRARAS